MITKTFGEQKTRSGKTQYCATIRCECGFGTKGSNTFSAEHLKEWASKTVEWHVSKDHK